MERLIAVAFLFMSFISNAVEHRRADQVLTGMTQDKNGFIYFAGHQGLTRFDGQRYQSMDDLFDLKSSWIRAINITPDGLLLITSQDNGLWIADPKTYTVTNFSIMNIKLLLPMNTVFMLHWVTGWFIQTENWEASRLNC